MTAPDAALADGARTQETLGFHLKKVASMLRSVPTYLFVLYVGVGVIEVLDSTLSRMHLPGGASAGASTVASPFSMFSPGASGDAIDQWNQWSNINTLAAAEDAPGSGLPLGLVLVIYIIFDVFLIAVPIFLILKSVNRRAKHRLEQFTNAKKAEKLSEDSDVADAARDALDRVAGLDGLLKMAFAAAVAFLVADVVEDVLLFAAGTRQSQAVIIATGLVSLVKWLMLATALIGLVVGSIGSRGMRQDPAVGIRTNVAEAGRQRAYLLAFRIQIAIGLFLLLFGALRGDLGHQLDDAFLAPFGNGGSVAVWTGVLALVLVVVLLVTMNLCMRAYLPHGNSMTSEIEGEDLHEAVAPKHDIGPKIWICVGLGIVFVAVAVLAVAQKWPFGMAFAAPGGLLLVVAAYSKFAAGVPKPDIDNTSRDSNRGMGLGYSIAIAVVPLVVLGALAIRNGVRLLTIHQYGYAWKLIIGFPLVAAFLGSAFVVATFVVLKWLGRIDDRKRAEAERRDGRPAAWGAVIAGALAVLIFVIAGSSPQPTGNLLGAWGAILTLAIALALAGTALVMFSDRIRAWGVVSAMGFRRTPFIAAILICFIVNSMIDDRYVYHDVRLGTELADGRYHSFVGTASTPKFQLQVTDALDRWAQQQLKDGDGRREIPLVFVASAGGGIRAAYWTALVMRCLVVGHGQGCPKPVLPQESIFVASGISGGSLGLAGIHGVPDSNEWVKALERDFLGPAIAALAFRDLPNSLFRLNIRDADRATILERAWENAASGHGGALDRGLIETAYRDDGSINFPLLILNGTSVTDGCRVAASALDLSTVTYTDSGATSNAADCLALEQKRFSEAGVALPALPATRDAFDNTCSSTGDRVPHDLRLSTAALVSARFPYVSPSGALYSCFGDDRTFDLDGGLIDSSAALPLTMLWPEIVNWLDNQDLGVCIAPKLIIMENGYLEQTKSEPPARPDELTAPVTASMATQAAASPMSRQAAALMFQKSFEGLGCDGNEESSPGWTVPNVVDFYPVAQPGIEAPLGWTLSVYSQESLASQVTNRDNRCAAAIVDAWFTGSTAMPADCGEQEPQ